MSLERRLTKAQSTAIAMGIILLLLTVAIFCYIAFVRRRQVSGRTEERPIISSPIVRSPELFEMTSVRNDNYYEREGMPSIDER